MYIYMFVCERVSTTKASGVSTCVELRGEEGGALPCELQLFTHPLH